MESEGQYEEENHRKRRRAQSCPRRASWNKGFYRGYCTVFYMDGYERMVVQRQVARPAQATYDLKHTKEKKARHQYKSGMCGVVMVVQDAMNYADKWKQCVWLLWFHFND